MQYLLVLLIVSSGHPPVVQQVGPYGDLIACEKAAGQAEILKQPSGIFSFFTPRVDVYSFCSATRSYK